MSENVEHLIIEHLKALRNEVKANQEETREEFREVKARLHSLETGIARIVRDEGQNYAEIVQDRHIVDKIKERLDRIERRLELS